MIELGALQTIVRLIFAAAAGALVGIDREARGKPAGFRTHALVALGAALVTVCTIEYLATVGADPSDVTRVIQGVIAGVGFLGGGAILRAQNGDSVTGLTTAATIWIVAAVGIACGGGHWLAAASAVVLVEVILVFGRRVDGLLHRKKMDGDHSSHRSE